MSSGRHRCAQGGGNRHQTGWHVTTGCTETQLQEFRDEALRLAPPHPTHADLKTAPELRRVAMAGTDVGALVRLALRDHPKSLTFFLNPVIALELIIALNQAAMNFKWWGRQETSGAKPLGELEREALNKALRVVSIVTASEPNGLLVRFAGGDTFTFYIPGNSLPRS
jgi:hypothetical protein